MLCGSVARAVSLFESQPQFFLAAWEGDGFSSPIEPPRVCQFKITAMLTLACRNTSPARIVILSRWCRSSSIRHQSTVPKEAAGPFTTNSKISSGSRPEDKTLVYLGTIFSKNSTQLKQHSTISTNYTPHDNHSFLTGPFSDTIRKYKITASLFTLCGMCAVPALLATGQAPVTASILGRLKRK